MEVPKPPQIKGGTTVPPLVYLILALVCLRPLKFFILHFHLWQVLVHVVACNYRWWLSSNFIYLCSCGRISSNHTFLFSSFSFWFVLIPIFGCLVIAYFFFRSPLSLLCCCDSRCHLYFYCIFLCSSISLLTCSNFQFR